MSPTSRQDGAAADRGERDSDGGAGSRHQARQSAVELLYAWQIGGCDPADVAPLVAGRIAERRRMDTDYFRALVEGVITCREELDGAIAKALTGRRLEHVGAIELAILRVGCWELSRRLEIPYRVILDEAVELGHEYGDDPVPSFVNGILDRLARTLRAAETAA
ncbi:MAG: transcription antitermination factor NusB [Zetaproteobacteria bacterium]|nr:MAG: transcription antitermination factor NusB [Zetaproteobacteria bacterium]